MKFSVPNRSQARGFTLIELLVVIAIISMLAAILFPVFSRVREVARRTSCASNLKQIGLGISQYIQDNDERIPLPGTATPTWRQAIYSYVKSTQMYSCPSRPGRNGVADAALTTPIATYPAIPISYSANGFFLNIAGRGTSMDQGSLSVITEPSRRLMVVENARNAPTYAGPTWDKNTTTCTLGDTNWTDYFQNTQPNNYFAGHLGTMSYLFVDGHVKSLQPISTASPYNMWGATNHCSTDPGPFRSAIDRLNSSKPDSAVTDGMSRLQGILK